VAREASFYFAMRIMVQLLNLRRADPASGLHALNAAEQLRMGLDRRKTPESRSQSHFDEDVFWRAFMMPPEFAQWVGDGSVAGAGVAAGGGAGAGASSSSGESVRAGVDSAIGAGVGAGAGTDAFGEAGGVKPINRCGAHGCTNQGALRCGGCRKAYYCGQACQKTHWRTHKPDCKP